MKPKCVREAFRLLKQTHITVDSEDISLDDADDDEVDIGSGAGQPPDEGDGGDSADGQTDTGCDRTRPHTTQIANQETHGRQSWGTPASGRLMPWSGSRRRLLVAGPDQALAAFRAELAAVRPAYLAELRLEVVVESSAQCSTRLFGLDGGCKLRQPAVLPLRDIFAAVESMPMRLAEVRRRR